MTKYKVTDYTGESTIQEAPDTEEAIQRHMIHFGLLWLREDPAVEVTEDGND